MDITLNICQINKINLQIAGHDISARAASITARGESSFHLTENSRQSTGGSIGMQFAGNMVSTLMVGVNGSASAESTTKSAVSEGVITIRDKEKQSQNVDDLSRDAEHANQTLSPIFDKEKEQRRLQEAQLIGQIGVQVADIARTRGEIAAAKAQNDPQAIEAAKAALAKAGKTSPTEKELREQIRNTAMEPYGTGSALQQGIQAATAAIQGLAGGDITKAIAGGAAPYLAEVIHDMTADPTRPGGINTEANLMAHAVVGAVLAEMQGNGGLAGAAGAVTGEYLARQLYPDTPRDKLSEEQKQTLSALSTLTAGLAGGLAGDSTADAIAGGQAGKNAAENNSLSGDKARAAVKESAEHWKGQVRNALGEGTTSSIANGIINAIADTGDSAIGSADYVADAAMALTSCAAGDSYCTKAMSDLAGKNQAVADSVKALMQSETWLAVAETVKQASDGNQMELEATGGMIASIILPGKKVPEISKLAHLTADQQKLIKNAESISTAKPGKQSPVPRDLNEQVFWKQVESNPSQGGKLDGLNNDPRFPVEAGFQKMESTHRLPDGSTISIHYQYNSNTGKAYDMKITTPLRNSLQPGPSFIDRDKK